MKKKNYLSLESLQQLLSVLICVCGLFTLLIWATGIGSVFTPLLPGDPLFSFGLLAAGGILLRTLRPQCSVERYTWLGISIGLLFLNLLAVAFPEGLERIFQIILADSYEGRLSSLPGALFFTVLSIFLISVIFRSNLFSTHLLGGFCLVVLSALTLSTSLGYILGHPSLSGFIAILQTTITDSFYFVLLLGNAWIVLRIGFAKLPRMKPFKRAFLASFGVALSGIVVTLTIASLSGEIIRNECNLILKEIEREVRDEVQDNISFLILLKKRFLDTRLSPSEFVKDDELLDERVSVVRSVFLYGTQDGEPILTGQSPEIHNLNELRSLFPEFDSSLADLNLDHNPHILATRTQDNQLLGLAIVPLPESEIQFQFILAILSLDSFMERLLVPALRIERFLVMINGEKLRTQFSLPEKQFLLWGSSSQLKLNGLVFTVQIIPESQLFIHLQVISIRILWLVGIVAVVLTWLVVIRGAQASSREREALAVNERLEVEIERSQSMKNRLKQANVELKRSNLDLQEFAQVASHDLQEPLRKIQAFNTRILEGYHEQLDDKGKDYLRRMNRSVHRMSDLIEDLLNFARVQTKGQPLVPVDINIILEEVQELLERQIEGTGCKLTIQKNIPIVLADASQIRQVFQNLISNAMKFSNEGIPPEINIYWKAQGGKIHFEVNDNGIGIERVYLKRIFHVFERLNPQSKFEGTGIGLAICKRIIERHGGVITAESEPGNGTVFKFYLERVLNDQLN